MAANLAADKFWVNKNMYHEAEKAYYEGLAKKKEKIKNGKEKKNKSKKKSKRIKESDVSLMNPSLNGLGTINNAPLEALLEKMGNAIMNLSKRIEVLEQRYASSPAPEVAVSPATTQTKASSKAATPSKPAAKNDDNDDDDVDLFGSDSEEDEEAKKLKDQRLAEYAAKKSKKPALIAKSNIILDIKPWDDETDMAAMEKAVRDIQMDGLVWGASKLVPVAFKIFKLQISCVVEDDKVSVDLLSETLEKIEDYIQSVDIAAFNKV